jgi:hypothetical protein
MDSQHTELTDTTLTVGGKTYLLRNLSSVTPIATSQTSNQWRVGGFVSLLIGLGLIVIGIGQAVSGHKRMPEWAFNTNGRLYLEAKNQRTIGMIAAIAGVGFVAGGVVLIRRARPETEHLFGLSITTNAGERDTIVFPTQQHPSSFHNRLKSAIQAAPCHCDE